MSRVPHIPTAHTMIRDLQRRVLAQEKKGPDRWVYVGTYESDLFTTPESPPWENGYDHAAVTVGPEYTRVKFRWDEHGRLEFDGHIDANGGTNGTAAFTLPDDYVINTIRSWTVDVITGSTPTTAQILIPAGSGEVQVTLL